MAGPGGRYHIQEQLGVKHAHHESFKALWETKWKKPCEMGVYPFMFGSIQDFQPVVDDLIAKDTRRPYDWDAYASAFFPQAEKLLATAQSAQHKGEKEKAAELFLRASALYRIARFPVPRSSKQREAWKRGKEAAISGLSLHNPPTHEIQVPHTHAASSDGASLPVYYKLPTDTSQPVPLVILFTGLDGYRTELAVWAGPWAGLGVATIVTEIPGTGDNPGTPSDPLSGNRVWDSLFEWIDKQPEIDKSRVAVWGFSTGGYYAIRIAHTHKARVLGAASQGGGCHHMFDAPWLDGSNVGEYPFDLGSSLALKYGYIDFEKFKKEARGKYSLLDDGTLDKECSRLLLVNGEHDSIFPVDDMIVACQRGGPKEVRLVKERAHMGEPEAFFVILKWLFDLLGVEGHVGKFMSQVPTKTKY